MNQIRALHWTNEREVPMPQTIEHGNKKTDQFSGNITSY